MPVRLKERQKQIPGGFRFIIPALKWQSTPWASLDSITRSAIGALQGNPHIAQKLGWDLSYESMINRVDEYNALVCQHFGWADYFVSSEGGAAEPSPFPAPHQAGALQRLGSVAAGAKTLVHWISSGAEAVPKPEAELRAGICAQCPANEKGDLLSFFTMPVAEAIREAYNQRRGWSLSTSSDHLLGVCTACDCPLRLKIHLPMDRILTSLKPEQKAALHPNCWIRSALK